ncbi:MFS transporter [Vibrio navarrensis]|uniref:MFS transporter n=1 Tax=Vibrio navarrensis TaxID=29495 RepID=UPI00186AB2A7|nr:MFS transporter [Vibrio navarrensis]MBE4620103.1 MFS transporter [Vibrio navarrensis]
MNLRTGTQNRTLPYLSGRFFDGISSGLFMMALPWIMLQTPDMGSFVAMTALACTAISFVLTPFFSTLVDRHSRKQILVFNQVLQASTAALVALAYLFGLGSHLLLALAQLIFWVSSNLAWSTNNAFTQENYDAHEYAAISGQQEVVMQGTTLGAGALGVVLLEYWGVVEFALFAAFASALATLSYCFTPYRRQLRLHQPSQFWTQMAESKTIFSASPRFYAIILLSCLSYPVLTFLSKLVPIWFAEQQISGDWFAGYNIAFGLGSLITGLLVSRILALTSPLSIIQYSLGAAALALVGMSFSASPAFILLFTAGFGFFNALNRIARINWMHHTIPIEQRGRVDGGIGMFSTLVQSLSYVLIAMLNHYQSTQSGFAIAALVLAVATLVIWLLRRNAHATLMSSAPERSAI